MDKWHKRKWLVNLWYGISGFALLLFIIVPSTFNLIYLLIIGGLTFSAHRKYRQAKGVKMTDISKSTAEESVVTAHKPVAQQSSQAITPPTSTQPALENFTFNVAGVTMENDKKQDIQKLLVRNGKLHCEEHSIDLYSGWTNKEILEGYMEVSEFEDLSFRKDEISFIPEPTNEYDPNAIKVCINFDGTEFEHVGYVPKKNCEQLKSILETKEVKRCSARYVGGKIKEVEYDDDKDKDVVKVKELTLGVEIEIAYTM